MTRIPAAENNLNFCPQKYLPMKHKSKRSPGKLTLYRSLLRNITTNRFFFFCKLAIAKHQAGGNAVVHSSLTLHQHCWVASPWGSGAVHTPPRAVQPPVSSEQAPSLTPPGHGLQSRSVIPDPLTLFHLLFRWGQGMGIGVSRVRGAPHQRYRTSQRKGSL